MTPTPSSAFPVVPNKPTGNAAPSEGDRLPDGRIMIWEGGRLSPEPRLHVLLLASWLQDSPCKPSQERAVRLRRACLAIVN